MLLRPAELCTLFEVEEEGAREAKAWDTMASTLGSCSNNNLQLLGLRNGSSAYPSMQGSLALPTLFVSISSSFLSPCRLHIPPTESRKRSCPSNPLCHLALADARFLERLFKCLTASTFQCRVSRARGFSQTHRTRCIMEYFALLTNAHAAFTSRSLENSYCSTIFFYKY